MGVTETDRAVGCRADPKVSDCRIVPRAGILVRLTRNCDKQRGFVNGAIGEIVTVLSPNCFTVRLKTGTMVLVHPICGHKEVPFLPCTYGYATTIRRAQGMTLNRGCVFFDLAFPPDRGYAYVAVSRFRTRAGVYHFGRYRRSDWLPVGEAVEGVFFLREARVRRGGSRGASAQRPRRRHAHSSPPSPALTHCDACSPRSDLIGCRAITRQV